MRDPDRVVHLGDRNAPWRVELCDDDCMIVVHVADADAARAAAFNARQQMAGIKRVNILHRSVQN